MITENPRSCIGLLGEGRLTKLSSSTCLTDITSRN